MAINEPGRRWLLTLLLGGGLAVGWFVWNRTWLATPQLANDEQIFKEVDALFTALTTRNRKLLADCEQRLQAGQGAGQVSPAAARVLADTIQQAQAGEWEPAARRLYDFMLDQRRE